MPSRPPTPGFRMQWVPPAPRAAATPTDLLGEGVTDPLRARDAIPPAPSEVQQLLRGLGHFEITAPDGRELSIKDELVLYLRLAAEIEHALLVQYLYAFASFESAAANAHCRDLVRTVALQEMAHLVTVQNLLMLVDGPDAVYFGRDNMRATAPENPIPLSLQPIGRLTIEEYVLAEAPLILPEDLEQRIVEIRAEVLANTARDPQRVGAVYARIYWLFQPSDAPSGPLSLSVDPTLGFNTGRHVADLVDAATLANYEATLTEWVGAGPAMLVLPATTRDEALVALAKIMGQGEGVANSTDSHFRKFIEVLDAFNGGLLDIRPLPTTPCVAGGPADEGPRTPLQHPYVRAWGELFNLRYTMLIVVLSCAIQASRADNNGEDRELLLGEDVFHRVMHHIRPLMEQMASRKLMSLEPCGPPFELQFDHPPATAELRWRAFSELLRDEKAVAERIKAEPLHHDDAAGRALLSDVLVSNDVLTEFVTGHLA